MDKLKDYIVLNIFLNINKKGYLLDLGGSYFREIPLFSKNSLLNREKSLKKKKYDNKDFLGTQIVFMSE